MALALDFVGKVPQNDGNVAIQRESPLTAHAVIAVPVDDRPGILRRVEEMLGVRRLKSDHDLVTLVEERLPTRALESLCRHGLSDEEAYALILPRRTLAHRRARREPLSGEESDRVVRLARMAAFAERVFGDRERAWRWLRKAKRQFQGRSPLELMATEAGARLVEELLYAIDEGMAA